MCVIQDPPPINDVTASTSRTPSDLSGFDIFVMWTVSGLALYVGSYMWKHGSYRKNFTKFSNKTHMDSILSNMIAFYNYHQSYSFIVI